MAKAMGSEPRLDISVGLRSGLPVWPGSAGVTVRRLSTIGEDSESTVSRLELELHTGTHLDAPLHAIPGGSPIEAADLERTIGPAWVADAGEAQAIGGAELDKMQIPHATKRLLIKTLNSKRALYESEFTEDYTALTLDGAEWVVKRDMQLIGIDYLSIQRISDSFETHRVLLGAGTRILEGIDLRGVEPGGYELICLPLSLNDVEAAPARAILRPLR